MDQVNFLEDLLGRPYHFKFFKGCLPQISLGLPQISFGPFLNIWTQIIEQFGICLKCTYGVAHFK